MLGFARNIVFFRVNGGSVAENSWLVRATVLGVAAFAIQCLQIAVEWLRQGCSLRQLRA